MSIITVDNVNYETELFSERGKGLVQALLEADVRLREATMTATLLQAANYHVTNAAEVTQFL